MSLVSIRARLYSTVDMVCFWIPEDGGMGYSIAPAQSKNAYSQFRSRLEQLEAAKGRFLQVIAYTHPYLQYIQFLFYILIVIVLLLGMELNPTRD